MTEADSRTGCNYLYISYQEDKQTRAHRPQARTPWGQLARSWRKKTIKLNILMFKGDYGVCLLCASL
jgi:hypothetical protein